MKISKQIIKEVIATLDAYGCGAHHPDLLPLLEQQEREHVATVASWVNGTYWRNYKLKWHKDVPEGTKLYTHPAPFTPITADIKMLTDDEAFDVECNSYANTAKAIQQAFCAKNNINLGAKPPTAIAKDTQE